MPTKMANLFWWITGMNRHYGSSTPHNLIVFIKVLFLRWRIDDDCSKRNQRAQFQTAADFELCTLTKSAVFICAAMKPLCKHSNAPHGGDHYFIIYRRQQAFSIERSAIDKVKGRWTFIDSKNHWMWFVSSRFHREREPQFDGRLTNSFTFFIDVPNNHTRIQFREIASQFSANATTAARDENHLTRDILKLRKHDLFDYWIIIKRLTKYSTFFVIIFEYVCVDMCFRQTWNT